MRPSLIVMPVLVCVPFGLAIRETMTRVTPEEQAAAQQVKDQIRDQIDLAKHQIHQHQLANDLRQLYGTKPASLGTLFDDVSLGMPAAQVHSERADAFAQERRVTIALEPEYERLAHVVVRVADPFLCDALSEQLERAWGAPVRDVWLAPATQQSARLDEKRCVVRFAKYTPLTTWIGDKRPAWLGLVGTNVEKLRQQELVEQADQFDDDTLAWTQPGLDGSDQPIVFTARVERRTIVGMSIDVRADDETITAVFDRLERVLGKAKEIEGASTFAGTPVVKFLRLDRDHAEIRVGKAEAPESDL